MKEKIKNCYLVIKIFFMNVLNIKGHYRLNLFTRLKYAFKNFSANEYYWYNLRENDYREYISEYERIKGRNINGDYNTILDNKILFEEIFRNYVKVPTNYAYVSNGFIYPLHNSNLNNDNFFEFIKKEKICVLKMLNGYEGNGVYILKCDNNAFYVNETACSEQDISELLKKCNESIICEYIFQSDFENELFNKSTNTLRIVCAKSKTEKYAHIIKAVQRIGCNDSKPVDNISKGALASSIDIETGTLGSVVKKVGDLDEILIPLDKHPDNDVIIKGKIIPNWNKIKKEIESLTNNFPYLNLVAWDVLLTKDGICLIEGNASSGVGLFQLEHGIRNEEYGQILKSYNILK